MFLKFVRKAYSQLIRKQSQVSLIDDNCICSDRKTFVKTY